MILLKSSLRFLKRNFLQSLLAILGITLSIAIICSIDLAIESSKKSFQIASQRTTGKATHEIRSADGRAFDETIFINLKRQLGIKSAAPVVEKYVSIESEYGAEVVKILGINIFSEKDFRDWTGFINKDLIRNFKEEGVFINSNLAKKHGWKSGSEINIEFDSRFKKIKILGIIDDDSESLNNLLLGNITYIQSFLNEEKKIHKIDLIKSSSGYQASKKKLKRAEIKSLLPEELQIIKSQNKSKSIEEMRSAFDINLMALSLLSVLVAVFLIYNSVSFSVIQRRRVFAILRSMGLEIKKIIALVMIESLIFGILGTILGLALGLLLAKFLMVLISETINDLYFTVEIQNFHLSGFTVIKSVFIGIVGSLIAGLIPAWNASKTSPKYALSRFNLEKQSGLSTKKFLFYGLCTSGIAALMMLIKISESSLSLALGFLALFLLITGVSIMSPFFVKIISEFIEKLVKKLKLYDLNYAIRSIRSQLSRNAIAIAALMIALSVSVALDITISSFRNTVENWLENSLKADIYISSPSLVLSKNTNKIPEKFLNDIKSIEDKNALEILSYFSFDTYYFGKFFNVSVVDPKPIVFEILKFNSKSKNALDSFIKGENMAFISEPFAYKNKFKVGDEIKLFSKTQELILKVEGIYYDYGSNQGSIMIPRNLYEKYWLDNSISSVGLILKDKSELERITRIIEDFSKEFKLSIRSNVKLKNESLEIFDKTFRVTSVLKFISLIVAFIAIVSAFLAIQLERKREFGVLKALGMSTREIAFTLIYQSSIMGLIAVILSIPLGFIQSSLMLNIINKRSFGWSLEWGMNYESIYTALIVGLMASLIAVIYPIFKIHSMKISEVIRDE